MRHFVHRQRLLAFAVTAKMRCMGSSMKIDHGRAVFAEQTCDVVAAIGRDQGVVLGLAADYLSILVGGDALRIGAIGDESIGIEEAVGEAAARPSTRPTTRRACPTRIRRGLLATSSSVCASNTFTPPGV